MGGEKVLSLRATIISGRGNPHDKLNRMIEIATSSRFHRDSSQ